MKESKESVKLDKSTVIKTHQTHEKDTGSTEVQIGILTNRINYLVEHLKKHKKDHHTRRGLIILVGQRKRLLKYLSKKDVNSYKSLIKLLKLKG